MGVVGKTEKKEMGGERRRGGAEGGVAGRPQTMINGGADKQNSKMGGRGRRAKREGGGRGTGGRGAERATRGCVRAGEENKRKLVGE